MPTIPLPIARAIFGLYYRTSLSPLLPWTVQRALLDAGSVLLPLPERTVVDRVRLGERTAERITVGETTGPEAVLYLHGGGFTVGSLATHRSLAAHLAGDIGRPVYLLDYRLAPAHPCPAALEDTIEAFDALIRERGYPVGSVALAGDSAGGGIALATTQWLVARGGDRPPALVLLSPWTNPVGEARRRDTVVSRRWGFASAAAYLGRRGDVSDPRFAPLFGDFAGLPPTYLHVGVRELLHPQILELAVAMRDAQVPLHYVEHPTLWHSGQAQAGLVREAAESLRAAGEFLTTTWSARHADAVPVR
ncbi:alpha/beta hydrolase [Nocardia sp. NPDC051570]|uniref:alpha/beta hydrolase n=1 Tax=Nocardia sp. NPDC051570 TaxID=3364324 RepID=UPI00379DD232